MSDIAETLHINNIGILLVPLTDTWIRVDPVHRHDPPHHEDCPEHQWQDPSNAYAIFYPPNAWFFGLKERWFPLDDFEVKKQMHGGVWKIGDLQGKLPSFLYKSPLPACDECAKEGVTCVVFQINQPRGGSVVKLSIKSCLRCVCRKNRPKCSYTTRTGASRFTLNFSIALNEWWYTDDSEKINSPKQRNAPFIAYDGTIVLRNDLPHPMVSKFYDSRSKKHYIDVSCSELPDTTFDPGAPHVTIPPNDLDRVTTTGPASTAILNTHFEDLRRRVAALEGEPAIPAAISTAIAEIDRLTAELKSMRESIVNRRDLEFDRALIEFMVNGLESQSVLEEREAALGSVERRELDIQIVVNDASSTSLPAPGQICMPRSAVMVRDTEASRRLGKPAFRLVAYGPMVENNQKLHDLFPDGFTLAEIEKLRNPVVGERVMWESSLPEIAVGIGENWKEVVSIKSGTSMGELMDYEMIVTDK